MLIGRKPYQNHCPGFQQKEAHDNMILYELGYIENCPAHPELRIPPLL